MIQDNFSASAKNSIDLAREAAFRLGNDHIGMEHLLLAILKERGTAVEVLRHLKVDVYELHKELELTIEDKTGRKNFFRNDLLLTKQSEKAIRISLLEAKALMREIGAENLMVDTGHFMLAILKIKQNITALVMHKYNVDYDSFRAALIHIKAPFSPVQSVPTEETFHPKDVPSVKEKPDHQIFFSYAWEKETEKMVDLMYDSFMADGYQVIRDRKDLHYKDLISDFMRHLGTGKFIIVALSDKYLRSENCMFELVEMFRNSGMQKYELIKKIYPIRIENLNLGNPKVITDYFIHWQEKEKEWEDLLQVLGKNIQEAQLRQYRKIKKIMAELGELLDILNDVNSLTKELLSNDNFAEIKKAIKDRMQTS